MTPASPSLPPENLRTLGENAVIRSENIYIKGVSGILPSTEGDLAGSSPRPELAQLHAHMDRWYADFDWQAMELALCAIAAHNAARDTQPIWPFIVGAPRTGKTEVIRALEGLPDIFSAGDLTPKALMSGWNGKGMLRWLNETGKRIILFKDFTTILGKRVDDSKEIMAMFREIADGDFSRWTGQGQVPSWSGKLTIIAGVTPAIEDHWTVMNLLGPRFLFVRWPTPEPIKTAGMARQQIKHEKEIHHESQRLVRRIIDNQKYEVLPILAPGHSDILDGYCAKYVQLRTPVTWDSHWKFVRDVAEPEGAGAISKHLDLIARTRALFHGRDQTTLEDLALSKRVTFDSVPQKRLKVIRSLNRLSNIATIKDIAQESHLPYALVSHIIQELEAIGCCEYCETQGIDSEVRSEFYL